MAELVTHISQVRKLYVTSFYKLSLQTMLSSSSARQRLTNGLLDFLLNFFTSMTPSSEGSDNLTRFHRQPSFTEMASLETESTFVAASLVSA